MIKSSKEAGIMFDNPDRRRFQALRYTSILFSGIT